jgi:phage FluMu protein Com
MSSTAKKDDLKDVRCGCGNLLLRVSVDAYGMVEIICRRCKVMNRRHFGLGVDNAPERREKAYR